MTREDGSVAQGAAVIATDIHGRQEYGMTNEEGRAELNLFAYQECYATYEEELFPYVDLWMSERWNEHIEVLAFAN